MEIKDMGEHNTLFLVSESVTFLLPKRGWKRYLVDAKIILDKASKDLNSIGIASLMGALLLLHEEGYNGRHNHCLDVKAIDVDAEYGVMEAKIAACIMNAGISTE